MREPEIHLLNWPSLERLRLEQMPEDFPAAELKPLPLLRRLYGEGRNRSFVRLGPDGALTAYAVFELPARGAVWLLDYLAVRKTARGAGIGSRFLRELRPSLAGAEAVVLEIERVDRARDESERAVRERRKRFYLRNGLCETGVFTRADGGIEYELLSLPLTSAPRGAGAETAIRCLYETIFPEGGYEIHGA